VIRAHEVTTILSEKLIIDPIHGDTDVTATVYVGEILSLEIDQDRFHTAAPAPQGKFLAVRMSQLPDAADKPLW